MKEETQKDILASEKRLEELKELRMEYLGKDLGRTIEIDAAIAKVGSLHALAYGAYYTNEAPMEEPHRDIFERIFNQFCKKHHPI